VVLVCVLLLVLGPISPKAEVPQAVQCHTMPLAAAIAVTAAPVWWCCRHIESWHQPLWCFWHACLGTCCSTQWRQQSRITESPM